MELSEQLPPRFVPWQIRLLQIRLQNYQRDAKLSDTELAADIEAYTGKKISNDTVKRFINRFNKKPGEREQASTSPAKLKIIATYLLDKNIDVLKLPELLSRTQNIGAPTSFLVSLGYDIESTVCQLSTRFSGLYWARNQIGDTNYWLEMDIDVSTGGTYFNTSVVYSQLSALNNFESAIRYEGWGVLRPENNLFLHVKDVSFGENEFWLSAVSPDDFSEAQEVSKLVMVRHNDPLLLWTEESNDTIASEAAIKARVIEQVSENIVIFQYISKIDYDQIRRDDIISIKDGKNSSGDRSEDRPADISESPFLKNFRFKAPQDVRQSEDEKTREVSMEDLGKALIRAAKNIDSSAVEKLLAENAPVNYVDVKTGATALHYAAAFNDQATIRLLIKHPDIDYLIKDARGRLASEHAYVGGNSPVVGRLLFTKESIQMGNPDDNDTLSPENC